MQGVGIHEKESKQKHFYTYQYGPESKTPHSHISACRKKADANYEPKREEFLIKDGPDIGIDLSQSPGLPTTSNRRHNISFKYSLKIQNLEQAL
jgi:hypothetical protein